MAAQRHVEIDPVLQALGPMGRFQVIQYFVFYLSYLNDAYQLFSYIFTGRFVSHTCAPPNNNSHTVIPELHDVIDNVTTVRYEACSIIVTKNISNDVIVSKYPCVYGFKYDGDKYTSIVSEFDLVCDHSAMGALSQTLMTLGLGLGCAVVPFLSDRFGRKRTIIISQIFMLSSSVMAGLAPIYSVFLLAKFWDGFFQAGAGVTAVTAAIEMFPASHRNLASGFGSTLWWSICVMSLVPLGYLFREHSWRTLQLAVCASFSTMILQIILLHEPLRWLAINGKAREAVKVLETACRWNKKDPQKILAMYRELREESRLASDSEKSVDGALLSPKELSGTDDNDKKWSSGVVASSADRVTTGGEPGVQKLSWKHLLGNRRLRINAMCNWVIWIVNSLTYGALYLMSDTIATNVYIGLFLNALVEGASCIPILLCVDRFGRKKSIVAFHTLTGLSLVASSICFSFRELPALQMAATVFFLLGKLGIAASFNTLFMYTPEIFPTNLRSLALGSCYGASTIGGMLAPFAGLLARYVIWAPGAIFGTCNLLVLVLLRFIPESKGKEIPQTVEDVKAGHCSNDEKQDSEG